jgi:hypothetical protein
MTLYSDGICPENHCVPLVLAEKDIYFDHQVTQSQIRSENLQLKNGNSNVGNLS